MLELLQFNYLPPGFLECSARHLHRVVSGPSLIHLKGKKQAPLFVSILQHGNETVGLSAVQRLLKTYESETLPRNLSIFVGNIDAASQGLRRLEGQPDFNRMWPRQGFTADFPEAKLMREVYTEMQKRRPFASIDLHSNTGLNPHYACINKLENPFIHLAALFGQIIVYFIRPQGVQSLAFAELCPSVTLECGQINDQAGVDHAFEFLDSCLQLTEIPDDELSKNGLDLFHTVATVKVPGTTSFSFTDSTQDVYFSPDLETLNFKEVAEGHLFAVTHPDKQVFLDVIDESGNNVSERYFQYVNNEIRLKKSLMLSMITLDERVIRQDCFCYLMERISA
ncbi:MAG TPA: peptidase M14 [Gammaproteobacteria bacterium]|nr:peptidase M14 [Gammaproteobacteria bacterium]